MLVKNNKRQLTAVEKLRNENKLLHEQLRLVQSSLGAIKSGNIDALVVANEKDITIFTEKAADKIYRRLIEKMNEGAVIVSGEGIILYCNACFAGMVHQPQQKIAGQRFTDLIAGPSKQTAAALLTGLSVNPARQQIYLQASDNHLLPVLMSVNSVLLDDKAVSSIILTDIAVFLANQDELHAKTVQLEEKNIALESANKDLTAFTYLSSHDLQEPLRKIQNFVSCILLEDENKLSEKGQWYFQRLELSAKRMQLLIDDLLTYAQAKNSERKFEITDLKSIVNEVITNLENTPQQNQFVLDITALGTAPVIRFQFRQLIHNLVSNSLKFCKTGTKLRIKIKSTITTKRSADGPIEAPGKEYCHITYTDNGIGFDKQYSKRIFEVFQRLHTQEKYKGSGIGLAICKRIVENHKGIITATGKLNGGARFDIYLPETPGKGKVTPF